MQHSPGMGCHLFGNADSVIEFVHQYQFLCHLVFLAACRVAPTAELLRIV